MKSTNKQRLIDMVNRLGLPQSRGRRGGGVKKEKENLKARKLQTNLPLNTDTHKKKLNKNIKVLNKYIAGFITGM